MLVYSFLFCHPVELKTRTESIKSAIIKILEIVYTCNLEEFKLNNWGRHLAEIKYHFNTFKSACRHHFVAIFVKVVKE